jgi:hypothetical protein
MFRTREECIEDTVWRQGLSGDQAESSCRNIPWQAEVDPPSKAPTLVAVDEDENEDNDNDANDPGVNRARKNAEKDADKNKNSKNTSSKNSKSSGTNKPPDSKPG